MSLKLRRSKEWWLAKARSEPDVPIAAGRLCGHENFEATVKVGRLTNRAGVVDKFMADITVRCAQCKRSFQFLGLEAGIDLGGARVSIDGLEARIALCPQGEQPSMLDLIAVNFPPAVRQ